MSIEVACKCGKRLRARDELAGKKAKCPGCGATLQVPVPQPVEEDPFQEFELAPEPTPAENRRHVAAQPAVHSIPTSQEQYNPGFAREPAPAPTRTATPPRQFMDELAASGGFTRYTYLLLALTFIPLAWSVIPRGDGADAVEQTLEAHPEMAKELDDLMNQEFRSQADADEAFARFLDKLPGHKLEGAFLAHDTKAHWFFAFLSAALFMGVMLVCFPRHQTNIGKLLSIGAFTATLGILLLLGVQLIADWTYGRIFYGRGIIVLVMYILKFIGFSYRAALDPETNFFVSFFGFTFGVRMCEEFVKALPLLVIFSSGNSEMGWKGALLCGLVSGVGFGVSEGITYSSDFYNGISGGDMYLVRFVSCVALHAIWAGAAGILIYKRQDLLQGADSVWGTIGNALLLISVPMILHGLYDTLLKKDHEILALLSAVVSFAWFAWQIETARKQFPDSEEDRTPTPTRAIA